MKYIRQFSIILIFSFLGEIMKSLIPLPIPASIYGLVLLLAALCTGIVSLDSVRETGRFLTGNMQLMFIPGTVGLMIYWEELQSMLIPLVVIIIPVTVIVMAVSGKVTQAMIRRKNIDRN